MGLRIAGAAGEATVRRDKECPSSGGGLRSKERRKKAIFFFEKGAGGEVI